MPFVESILKFGSVSIIGMEKNCGKTVVLNHILSRLANFSIKTAVTSIGIDGETKDAVTHTAKPEITLHKGTLFATSQSHYLTRRLQSEILDMGADSTSLGRVVIAGVLEEGQVLLSGPGDTPSLKRLIDQFHSLGAELVLVDGALSRKSLASPSITEGMILCTGAALSLNIEQLVAQTKHTCNMINLPLYEGEEDVVRIEGMVTERILEKHSKKTIVIKDFTKLFLTAPVYRKFIQTGGEIKVETKSELIALCVNPFSPTGYTLNSEKVVERLTAELGINVYDVKNGKI